MKVTSSTPDRLVLEDKPWGLAIPLYGVGGGTAFAALIGRVDGIGASLLVGALGLGAIWVAWHFMPFQRFTFDRPSGTFTHQVRRITGTRTWERPLADIRRAADEGQWSDGNRLERVTLLTSDGSHPLESGFSGTSRDAVIKSINDWIGAGVVPNP